MGLCYRNGQNVKWESNRKVLLKEFIASPFYDIMWAYYDHDYQNGAKNFAKSTFIGLLW